MRSTQVTISGLEPIAHCEDIAAIYHQLHGVLFGEDVGDEGKQFIELVLSNLRARKISPRSAANIREMLGIQLLGFAGHKLPSMVGQNIVDLTRKNDTMNDIQQRLYELLQDTAERLRESRLPCDMAMQMERLAGQVEQPWEVAVVGRVKAGKSTFINALLGAEDELAKVGATETTATINYFRYGQPDPAKPVRCYWRNGKSEDVTREFLDSLQGNDLETLRRADGIHHLEYRLPNRYLEQVVLVDTPGLGAVVDVHQNRTAEYMQLYRQLRQRHDLETQELDSKADAVIYLTDAVARVTDRDFLDDFGQVTRGHRGRSTPSA